ncbi:MAG: TonB family protein [Verrucomicrobia bacterium]|nr:TonB family protein [Verrucomicrobiota bacterium]
MVATLLLVAKLSAEPPMASAPTAGSAPQPGAPELQVGMAGAKAAELRGLLTRLFPDGTIEQIDPAGVRIRHPGGSLQLDWSAFPPELRLGKAGRSEAVGVWKTPSPGYPFQARKSRVGGTIEVVIRTDAQGRVERAVVHSGLDPMLDEHVLAFIRREWAGPPLSVRWVPLSFQLRD